MKKIRAIAGLLMAYVLCANAFSGKSFLLYRSQGFDIARCVVGWQQLRVALLEGYYAGTLTAAVDYTRSFDAKSLNRYLFGGQALTFSGSRVADRVGTDLLADYFGLPADFKSMINFKPTIENVVADFDWYLALHYLCEGLFLRINTVLVHTNFDLHPCEQLCQSGVLNYPAGYMGSDRIDRELLPQKALAALSGTTMFGDLDTPLSYGKITGKQTETKFSDLYLAIGYLFASDEYYHIAGSVHAVVPTGTRSQACFLFEPQIGNGHHWAFGAGVNAHYDLLWCDEWNISVYLYTRVEHLFSSHQKRSFDLCNGPGSRYMLLQDMGTPLIGFTTGGNGQSSGAVMVGGQPIVQQYGGRIFNAINKTTFDTKIKINVQADLAFTFVLNYCAWEATLGYNTWVRSHEKLVCRERLPSRRYAIKGDAQLYGYHLFDFNPNPLFVGLNATQSKATLHAGQPPGNASHLFDNQNADNAANATFLGEQLDQSTALGVQGTGVASVEPVNGSMPAILLSDVDINVCSGLAPKAVSNSLFAHVSYIWYDRCGAIPQLGIGGKAEFASANRCKAAVSQWAVWLKGGITY